MKTATLESEKPLRADGLVQAFRAAFAEAGQTIADVDYRITDANGEQYWFKEAALGSNSYSASAQGSSWKSGIQSTASAKSAQPLAPVPLGSPWPLLANVMKPAGAALPFRC